MSKKKMSNSDHDLIVDNSKLKSCFSFDNDLKVGAVGEKYVQTIFGDANIAIEVKKDDWTTKSGNIAIEFESRGKPKSLFGFFLDINGGNRETCTLLSSLRN